MLAPMLNLSNTSEEHIERSALAQARRTTHLLAKTCDLVEWPFSTFANLIILDISQNPNFKAFSRFNELKNLQ